ncbi:MAG: hypothetical protein GDA52_09955 [Rhodobacteraceae bacterium]|nr:hypothetical protein [Paracoccaceae bacterium]
MRKDVIAAVPKGLLADAVRKLDSDDLVDPVENLEEHQQEAILDILNNADRVAIEKALGFPDKSVRRLMRRSTICGITNRTCPRNSTTSCWSIPG